MFISGNRRWYTASGQHASGRFLVLMTLEGDRAPYVEGRTRYAVRGIVRRCVMHQCGHFMMGDVTIADKRITVSGTYGSDGSLLDVSADVFEKGVPLPAELYDAWADDGGWNDAGSEGLSMAEWGRSIDKGARS